MTWTREDTSTHAQVTHKINNTIRVQLYPQMKCVDWSAADRCEWKKNCEAAACQSGGMRGEPELGRLVTGWSSVSLIWFDRILWQNLLISPTCAPVLFFCFYLIFPVALDWGSSLVLMEGRESKPFWLINGSPAADWWLNSDPELLQTSATVKPISRTAGYSVPPNTIDEPPPPLTFISWCFV